MDYLRLVLTVFSLVLVSALWKLFQFLIWRPYAVTRFFAKQGIRGPPYAVLSGSLPEIKKLKKEGRNMVLDLNSHDITPKVLPHYLKWTSEYGKPFLYWYGTDPRICITDPELAKQVLSNKFGFYTKPRINPTVIAMIGRGLALITGMDWVKHRRVVNPAFNTDKLKVMTKRMAACTLSTLQGWEHQLVCSKDHCKEIDIRREFQILTGDIIAHTAFGSSYLEGKAVFETQRELQPYALASVTDIYIPGRQYIPTWSNRQTWKLDWKIRTTVRSIVESRLKKGEESGYGDDLLGLLMGVSETASVKQADMKLNMHEIIEECKTFYFAGHETTSNLLTWTVFLLCLHPEWQKRLREEVLKECGSEVPDAETLNRLKQVNMVILEVLRLYCPVISLVRVASEDMKLGELMIPKDTMVAIPLAMIHRSKTQWGEDANEFNPRRFSDGVSKAAKHPNALLAFSVGPRACIGQNFAMMEAKLVIALILQRFSFSLSSTYIHAPVDNLTLQPQFGLPVVLKSLGV
ncbi:hypothetical protein MKW94_014888 [Papaver nudicaule]|uniref:Cytochrome P450 n=1 Tax=Papaver nudicaule TaxID=74823 RepID=A0AA42ARR1_PAPNU|nr:hypothetical protein [Papaver nudicaule]